MSSILQFPGASRATSPVEPGVDEDHVHALKAMLRYLHREASESSLEGTAAAITRALAVLDAEVARYGEAEPTR